VGGGWRPKKNLLLVMEVDRQMVVVKSFFFFEPDINTAIDEGVGL
jgi:hypothetical protein